MMQERTEFLHGGKALGRVLPPAGGKIESKSVFSKDMSLGKNTAQPARVRALRVRRSGLHPLEKMLAFLRSVSRFLDTLGRAASCSAPFFYLLMQSFPLLFLSGIDFIIDTLCHLVIKRQTAFCIGNGLRRRVKHRAVWDQVDLQRRAVGQRRQIQGLVVGGHQADSPQLLQAADGAQIQLPQVIAVQVQGLEGRGIDQKIQG